MEISDVRRRVLDTIGRARRAAAERRASADQAEREWEVFLERVAIPTCRQILNVLRAHGHPFTLFTPSGSVRLTSDRSAQDYVEFVLDTSGAAPSVLVRSRRRRGSRVIESERPVGEDRAVAGLTEEDVLANVLKELEPFVER